ncbi:ThuA domain-containing protein [Prolixibacteraceae bacterium JC049]|nr:ThuA domain-containing protein [Prolixibacteraceae bacterium JC049]
MFAMKNILIICLVALLFGCKQTEYKALIVTGQNNAHAWEESHPILKKIIENTGLFQVDVAISPKKGENMSTFSPEFKKYDVVVMDYDGDMWAPDTRKNFEQYVKNGGGVIVYHAANNPFPEWKEYNKITGLGGWGNRNEQSGPYLRWVDGAPKKMYNPGPGGSHGDRHAYVLTTRNEEHPIMKGFPKRWRHVRDELYAELRGPAENVEVLATAYSAPKTRGTGFHEPMLFTVKYGKGRVFHTTLGHVGVDDFIATQCAGFIYTLQRGAEWAASGKVTQPVPEDMPNVAIPLLLPGFKQYTLEKLFALARKYEVGKSEKPLSLIAERIRKTKGDTGKIKEFEKQIIKLLEDEKATTASKNYFCRELSWMGSQQAVPSLEKLAKNPATKEMAEYALFRLKK